MRIGVLSHANLFLLCDFALRKRLHIVLNEGSWMKNKDALRISKDGNDRVLHCQ